MAFKDIFKGGFWGFVCIQPQEHLGGQALMLRERVWGHSGDSG